MSGFTKNGIATLIRECYDKARIRDIEGSTKRTLHQNRSREWVQILAKQFEVEFESERDVRIFSKQNYSNRRDFGFNEFLYDIVVCRVGEVDSARHKKTLYYVQDVLWQVESEFARDSRQALIDFNKLVLGSARNKLFIGPQVKDHGSFLSVLRPAAEVCSGDVFAALIPHPSDWNENSNSTQVWHFEDKDWLLLS